MKPKRIQRKRTKGWKMPRGAVYVGRPTKWGNPFVVTAQPTCGCREAGCEHISIFRCRNAQDAVDSYRFLVEQGTKPDRKGTFSKISELRGKNLCCWCPLDKPCHADVLLEIANS